MANTKSNKLSLCICLKSCGIGLLSLCFLVTTCDVKASTFFSVDSQPHLFANPEMLKDILVRQSAVWQKQKVNRVCIPGIYQCGNTPSKDWSGLNSGSMADESKIWQELNQQLTTEREREEIRKFLNLLVRFKNVLETARNKSVLVVYETDIDHTLVHMTDGFPPEAAKSMLMLEEWKMVFFQIVKQAFRDVFVLVYNTARPTFEDSINYRDQSLNLINRRIVADILNIHSGSGVEGLLFYDLDDKERFLAIPDVLILGEGAKIEVASDYFQVSELRAPVDLKGINSEIKNWIDGGYMALMTLLEGLGLARLSTNVWTAVSQTSLNIYQDEPVSPNWQHLTRFFRTIIEKMPVSFARVLSPDSEPSYERVDRGHVALATANKGSIFRVAFYKVILEPLKKKPDRVMVFAAGDELPDLPALVPVLENKAHGLVSDVAIQERDELFAKIGVLPLSREEVDRWWVLSMIPSQSLLSNKECCGSEVKNALNDHKVVNVNGWGLSPFLEKIVMYLERHLGAADDTSQPEGSSRVLETAF